MHVLIEWCRRVSMINHYNIQSRAGWKLDVGYGHFSTLKLNTVNKMFEFNYNNPHYVDVHLM